MNQVYLFIAFLFWAGSFHDVSLRLVPVETHPAFNFPALMCVYIVCRYCYTSGLLDVISVFPSSS